MEMTLSTHADFTGFKSKYTYKLFLIGFELYVMTYLHRKNSDRLVCDRLAINNNVFTARFLRARCDHFDQMRSICEPKH